MATFVSTTTAVGATTGPVIPALTDVVADDLLILTVTTANQAIATPSGWTELPNSPMGRGTAGSSGGLRLAVFYKIATGADSALTLADAGSFTLGHKIAFRGVDTTAPIAAYASGDPAPALVNTMYFADVTTTANNQTVVFIAAVDFDAAMSNIANVYTDSTGQLVDLTERVDTAVTSGAGGGITVATATQPTIGTTDLFASIVGGSSTYTLSISLAIKDAASGGSSRLKHWTGSAWVAKPVKHWDGSAWVEKPLKYWSGSAWVA